MNKSLDVIKKAYKPYRYTIKNKATIIETTSGTYVVKNKKQKNIHKLYEYLKSRNFDYFPAIIEENRDGVNIFEYIEEIEIPKEQKAEDMIDLVALLHNKTSFFKEVNLDSYQEIYDNIINNINDLKIFYNNLFDNIENMIYLSPSAYLLIRNSSKINSALDFCESEIKEWFELVKNEDKQRVATIHNNLSTTHFIHNNKNYLISWENSKIDSPVLDLINFYKNDYLDLRFDEILKRYLRTFPLSNAELKLFYIVISIPPKIRVLKNEFQNCRNISTILDYIYKTEKLVRPYYSEQEEKK